MTRESTPDITFFFGPPADPDLRARHEQASAAPAGSAAERGASLEPRLAALLAERGGQPSILSSVLTFVLRSPVEVIEATAGYGVWKSHWCATLQIRPRHVRGAAEAVARLFREGGPALAAANALGLVLKLEWVVSVRTAGQGWR